MNTVATGPLFRRLPLVAVLALGGAALGTALVGSAGARRVNAAPPTLLFSTNSPDGLMAMESGSSGAVDTETADDFVTTSATGITSATFVGLLPTNPGVPGIQSVGVEFYNVFPLDSTNPPTVANVPTRVNSPSDVEIADRSSVAVPATATFSTTALNATFTAANSVVAAGIHASPGQFTGGQGAVTGVEVQFTVTFTSPLVLPAGHYYFVPHVQMSSGSFLWLSAPKPIVAPGTPLVPDLQTWIRTNTIDPNWLRVGTDIVGGEIAPQFNGTFSLSGEACFALDATPNPLPDGTAGSSYSQQLVGSGGVDPYSFSATGTLPNGITLTPGGLLAGTPSGSGTFPFTVTVTDAAGCSSVLSRSLSVAAAATTTTATPTTTIAPSTTAAPTTTIAPTTTTARATAAPTTPLPTTIVAPTMPIAIALPATGQMDGRLLMIAVLLTLGGAGTILVARRGRLHAGG